MWGQDIVQAGTFWGGLNGSLCAPGAQLVMDIVRIKRYKDLPEKCSVSIELSIHIDRPN